MNYRELLQKYKAGELPEEQRKQVRQDIEKQDAISEYLFDNEEMEFEEQVEQDGGQTTESTDGSVPKDGQNVNIVGAAVPKDGQRTNVMEGTVPKDGQRTNVMESTVPKDGQRTNVIEGTVPKDGQRTNVIGGAVPKGGQRTNVMEGAVPKGGQEAEFTKLIRRAIRRTFIKYGVITGVIVIGIVCSWCLHFQRSRMPCIMIQIKLSAQKREIKPINCPWTCPCIQSCFCRRTIAILRPQQEAAMVIMTS